MKSSFIILLFLLPVLPVWGQFKVGYGLGWFPSGMNSLNVAQRYFNESKVAENIYGPLKDEGNYLPVYHGVAFEWSTTKRKKTNLQMNWINLHNKGESSRTNISDITYYHRTKSRINTFLIGMKTKPSSSRLSWVSSFTYKDLCLLILIYIPLERIRVTLMVGIIKNANIILDWTRELISN